MQLDPLEYQALVEFSPQMIWRCDPDGARDFFNRTWLEFTGRALAQELGRGWQAGIHPDDLQRCLKAYVDTVNQKNIFAAEYRLRRWDGEWRWVSDKGVPFSKDGGQFAGYIGSCIDINERAQAEHLKDLALADSLTGLYRRRYFEQRLDEEIRRAKRYHADVSLIKLDIDDFKSVNEKYGRAAGDKALKALAHIIRENVRSHDIASRLGGDEFCIALPHAKAKDAELTAARIAEFVAKETVTFDRQPIELAMSFAVVELADEISAAKLISRADRALFEAKRHGARQTAA